MFSLHSEPLDSQRLKALLSDPACGALVTFEGWVREHNEGQQVSCLDYEAYEALALIEGARIVEDAHARFQINGATCAHRIGSLRIGDMAVWVGVTSAHRAEAFEACRYIIDAIKHTVPIWKKEHYADGYAGWVNRERFSHSGGHSNVQVSIAEYYERQMRLPEVGAAGQERLRIARVLVVGAGGLGCTVLPALATAGIGTLGICDGDRVDISNLHRQPLYTVADVGLSKADCAASRLRALNPMIDVHTHGLMLSEHNARGLLSRYDLIVDCTDNFEAKYLLNHLAVGLRKALVQASIYQYEGQLYVYNPAIEGACMRCLWPEAPTPGCIGVCADVGVLGAAPAVLGAIQAMEVLKLLLDLPGTLSGEMLYLDLLSYRIRKIAIPKSETCLTCGPPSSVEISSVPAKSLELTLNRLTSGSLEGITLVDIRERNEAALLPLGDVPHLVWPASLAQEGMVPFSQDQTYLLCCTQGRRSRQLAMLLRKQGYDRIYSLNGGLRSIIKR